MLYFRFLNKLFQCALFIAFMFEAAAVSGDFLGENENINLNTVLPEVRLGSLLPLRVTFGQGKIVAPGDMMFSTKDVYNFYRNYRREIPGLDSDIKESLVKMIISEMRDSKTEIKFNCFERALKEINFRFFMISEYGRLINNSEYNYVDDTYELSKDWVSVVALFKSGGKFKPYNNCAFQPRGAAFTALKNLYTKKKKIKLDCSGFVITHTYGSLALTEGKSSFNRLHQSNQIIVTIAPIWAMFKAEEKIEGNAGRKKQKKTKVQREQHPIVGRGILTETDISDKAELLPGDVVYFMNHPSYSRLVPNGAWGGEYCIYLGKFDDEQKFVGLGLPPSEYSEVLMALQKAYQDETGEPFPADHEEEDGDEIIDATFPSLQNTIYTMHAYRKSGLLSK